MPCNLVCMSVFMCVPNDALAALEKLEDLLLVTRRRFSPWLMCYGVECGGFDPCCFCIQFDSCSNVFVTVSVWQFWGLWFFSPLVWIHMIIFKPSLNWNLSVLGGRCVELEFCLASTQNHKFLQVLLSHGSVLWTGLCNKLQTERESTKHFTQLY